MKDSQLIPATMTASRKYIKANNERFSTGDVCVDVML